MTIAAKTATISSKFMRGFMRRFSVTALRPARASEAALLVCGGAALDGVCGSAVEVVERRCDELIERQVQEVVAAFGVHEHLRRRPQDLLERLDVQALARNVRRLLVFGEDLREPVRLALRVRDHLLSIGLCFLAPPLGLAARSRQDFVRVGLRFENASLAVLAGPDRILHGLLDLASGNSASDQVHFVDRDPGVVRVERGLQQILSLLRDLGAPVGQDEIEHVAADHLADRARGRRLERRLPGRAG